MNNHGFLYNVKNSNDYRVNHNALFDLYYPILGSDCISLYMVLLTNSSYYEKNSNLVFFSDNLLNHLKLDMNRFNEARKKLEALNLLTTYLKKKNNEESYLFVLNSPLEFDQFMANGKYKSLLSKSINENNLNYLEFKYCKDNENLDVINVSSYFESVFNDQVISEVKSFDFDGLYKNIQKTTSLPIIINENCKNIIEGYYLKTSISLKDVENIVYKSVDMKDNCLFINENFLSLEFNKHFSSISNNSLENYQLNRNFNLFKKMIDENETNLIISDYRAFNSEQYLSIIFKNNLDKEQKHIINMLKNKYQLCDEVINVLIDFSLVKTRGKLNKTYLSKAASSLNGYGISTCLAAVEFLQNFLKQNHFISKTNKSESEVDTNRFCDWESI